MKHFLLFFLLFFCSLSLSAQKKEQFRLKTVVIDAGHGGSDPGAVYGKLYEKDITLDIAKRLGAKIKKSFPSIKVVYTRSTDKALSLKERGAIANRANGDIFISIHANSTADRVTKASGTETFTMGLHKSEESLAVAKKENSVITFEDDYEKSYEGFNPNDPESYIMFGLGQYSYSMLSILLANNFEKYYTANRRLPSRGVKQAGFLVLWYPAMPSILTEIGFINNPKDRLLMSSSAGKETLAESMFRAFKSYKKEVEVESVYTSESGTESVDTEIDFINYSNHAVGYAVQLIATSKTMDINPVNFGSHYDKVFVIKSGKWNKYFVGLLSNYEDAVRVRGEIRREKKYRDCYIVGINKAKITTSSEIKKILK